MREKILVALKEAGHGLTPNSLAIFIAMASKQVCYHAAMLKECKQMEKDHLLILHRADGSAGTVKGQIVLVCRRPKDH